MRVVLALQEPRAVTDGGLEPEPLELFPGCLLEEAAPAALADSSSVRTPPHVHPAGTAWDEAENVMSIRLIYAEARAALAQAARGGRITSADHDRAVRGLDELVEQMEFV